MSARVGTWSLYAAMAVAGCADDDRACTQIGCHSLAEIDFAIAGGVPDLTDATIEVCIGDRCVSDQLPRLEGMPLPPYNFHAGVALRGDFAATASVLVTPEGIAVSASFRQAENLPAGDVYAVSITRADGTLFVSRAWTATYEIDYPNGTRCGPECVYAYLTPVM